MSNIITRNTYRLFSAVCLAICIALSVYAYQLHFFSSQETLRTYIEGLGFSGAIVFVIFQIVQVVIPILPGGVSCLGGVLLFGTWKGLLYNYMGICIGSIAAFFIARNFGKPILYSLFSEKIIAKYEKWTGNDSKFTKLFVVAIFAPVAPDDFLCFLAGTTQMNWKRFTAVILLGKPLAIYLYSMGLNLILQNFLLKIH